MSDLAGCCSHLHVRYLRRTSNVITIGWWACDYCGTEFVPAGLHNLIVAENKDLHERVAFLESREVCTRPHKDVETCGYCQRDTLAAENERLRAMLNAADALAETAQHLAGDIGAYHEAPIWDALEKYDEARAALAAKGET